MELKAFMSNMIQTELEDAVGEENVSSSNADKLTYGVDYFWVSRMWVDKGETPPQPDFVVRPGTAEEVSKVLNVSQQAVLDHIKKVKQKINKVLERWKTCDEKFNNR